MIKPKLKKPYLLISIALFFLAIPNMNILDIFPDCVAYLIFIAVIGRRSETVPYLSECKDALTKLAMVTIIKIPAFSAMYSNLFTGRDIIPLFTLMFVALELILLYSAIENGYKAFTYIGERTDCAVVRDPFRINRRTNMTPEALRILTYVFVVSKGALNLLPEIMLLTPESFALRKKLSDAYPAVLVICIIASLVIGLIWLRHAKKYAKAIKRSGNFATYVDSLGARSTPEEITVNERTRKLSASLNVFGASGLFIFDITLEAFGGYNILPHFIYGIIMFCALFNLTSSKRTRILSLVSTLGFSVTSMLTYFYTKRFFESYTYINLSFSKAAKKAYLMIKIFSVAELVFMLLMLTAATLTLYSFIKEHTDVAPNDPSYSETNRRNHLGTLKRTIPLFVLSAVIGILKCVNVFFKQTYTVIYSEVNPEGITASKAPATDTIIFLLCIIYVIYSLVAASNLKDEVRFKYDKF